MTKGKARRLRREHSARVGMLQFSKSYQTDLTVAWIEDVHQRTRLAPKVRDARWAFRAASAKKLPILLTEV